VVPPYSRFLPLVELAMVNEERRDWDLGMFQSPTGWDKQPNLIFSERIPGNVPTPHPRVHELPYLDSPSPSRAGGSITPCIEFHDGWTIPGNSRRDLEDIGGVGGREKTLSSLSRALHPPKAYLSPRASLLFLRNLTVHILHPRSNRLFLRGPAIPLARGERITREFSQRRQPFTFVILVTGRAGVNQTSFKTGWPAS